MVGLPYLFSPRIGLRIAAKQVLTVVVESTAFLHN